MAVQQTTNVTQRRFYPNTMNWKIYNHENVNSIRQPMCVNFVNESMSGKDTNQKVRTVTGVNSWCTRNSTNFETSFCKSWFSEDTNAERMKGPNTNGYSTVERTRALDFSNILFTSYIFTVFMRLASKNSNISNDDQVNASLVKYLSVVKSDAAVDQVLKYWCGDGINTPSSYSVRGINVTMDNFKKQNANVQKLCACHMKDEEYDSYLDAVFAAYPQFNREKLGVPVLGASLDNVKCLFPYCSSSVFKDSSIVNAPCNTTTCLQAITVDVKNSIVNGDVKLSNLGSCAQYTDSGNLDELVADRRKKAIKRNIIISVSVIAVGLILAVGGYFLYKKFGPKRSIVRKTTQRTSITKPKSVSLSNPLVERKTYLTQKPTVALKTKNSPTLMRKKSTSPLVNKRSTVPNEKKKTQGAKGKFVLKEIPKKNKK